MVLLAMKVSMTYGHELFDKEITRHSFILSVHSPRKSKKSQVNERENSEQMRKQ